LDRHDGNQGRGGQQSARADAQAQGLDHRKAPLSSIAVIGVSNGKTGERGKTPIEI
jgi:hypothetical protein